MIWQDIVMTVCSLVFNVSLIPQIVKLYKKKKADQISWYMPISTCIGLAIYSFAQYTLGLYGSAYVGIASSTLWGFMILAKYKYGREK